MRVRRATRVSIEWLVTCPPNPPKAGKAGLYRPEGTRPTPGQHQGSVGKAGSYPCPSPCSDTGLLASGLYRLGYWASRAPSPKATMPCLTSTCYLPALPTGGQVTVTVTKHARRPSEPAEGRRSMRVRGDYYEVRNRRC
jgi:hypothetical protein